MFLAVILMAASVMAGNYVWTNGTLDNDFTNVNNWLPVPAGPFTSADNFDIKLAGSDHAEISSSVSGDRMKVADGNGTSGELKVTGGVSNLSSYLLVGGGSDNTSHGKLSISGGELTVYNSWTSIGNFGLGELEISGTGALKGDRINMANQNGSSASFTMTGGTLDIDSYIYIGVRSTATANISGGTVRAEDKLYFGAFESYANGTMDISGTASVEAGSELVVGRHGGGTVNVNGGSLVSENWMAVGLYANGDGEVAVSGGTVDVSQFLTVANQGTGLLSIDSGSIIADRMTIGQETGSSGEFLVSGGQVSIANQIQVSRDGSGKITLEGADATFACDRIQVTSGGSIAFALDGSLGVGSGIEVANDVTFEAGSEIDLSFLAEEADGTYTLMSAGGLIDDQAGGMLLSAASITDGWSYEIVDNGGLSELQVTVPEPAVMSFLIFGGLACFARKK